MKRLLFIWLLLQSCCLALVIPLSHGHAHNDYVHTRPLFEALENGFTSIEIDVYLHQGELKVAHLPFGLDKKKNIQQLYLDPIKKVIEQNGGNVYKGFVTPVIFMIDFKTGSSETYNRLKEILKNYESMITVYKGDSVIHQRAINILITGNSPLNPVLKEDSSVVTIDGNINDMNNTLQYRIVGGPQTEKDIFKQSHRQTISQGNTYNNCQYDNPCLLFVLFKE